MESKGKSGRVIRVKPRKIEELSGLYDCENIREEIFAQKLKELGVEGDFRFRESNKYWDFSQRDVAKELPEYFLWND